MPNQTEDHPEDPVARSASPWRPTRKPRVLMANEPRAYREGIAAAIGQLRPGVEVRSVEPHAMDGSILRLSPDMVVCSKATDTLKRRVRVWVELYPGHAAHSLASIGGRLREYAEIQLPDLLSILDTAEELTGPN
ncbi:MAG: hypothetical protein ACRDTR_07535 [Rubrobacter sp.]